MHEIALEGRFQFFLFFFCRIKKLLTEKKAKSERENSLIYHQKQPEVRRNSQNMYMYGLFSKREVKMAGTDQ